MLTFFRRRRAARLPVRTPAVDFTDPRVTALLMIFSKG